MSMELVYLHGYAHCQNTSRKPPTVPSSCYINASNISRVQSSLHNPGKLMRRSSLKLGMRSKTGSRRKSLTVSATAAGVPLPPLDLTEDNVKQVLVDAREEFGQIFDTEVGITGQVELAELDGPFVKIRLKGRFWHKRSTVLARVGNYLKQRIPEILEVDIEDDKQLDDSPENF